MTNLRGDARVVANEPLTEQIYRLRFECAGSEQAYPGQFVNVSIPGFFLRRPLAIADCEWCDGRAIVSVIIAKVGAGTRALAEIAVGSVIDVLGPLGHGFDMSCVGDRPVLIGGGSGIPPLYFAAKAAVAQGARPQVVLGFRTASAVYAADEFAALGCDVSVTTEDGSFGVRGYVTAALPQDTRQVLACGPEGMLRSLKAQVSGHLQVSLESHMGCGFGACLGCSVPTVRGLERVCVEGPVSDGADVLEEVA